MLFSFSGFHPPQGCQRSLSEAVQGRIIQVRDGIEHVEVYSAVAEKKFRDGTVAHPPVDVNAPDRRGVDDPLHRRPNRPAGGEHHDAATAGAVGYTVNGAGNSLVETLPRLNLWRNKAARHSLSHDNFEHSLKMTVAFRSCGSLPCDLDQLPEFRVFFLKQWRKDT